MAEYPSRTGPGRILLVAATEAGIGSIGIDLDSAELDLATTNDGTGSSFTFNLPFAGYEITKCDGKGNYQDVRIGNSDETGYDDGSTSMRIDGNGKRRVSVTVLNGWKAFVMEQEGGLLVGGEIHQRGIILKDDGSWSYRDLGTSHGAYKEEYSASFH